jgi:hypothetical protein
MVEVVCEYGLVRLGGGSFQNVERRHHRLHRLEPEPGGLKQLAVLRRRPLPAAGDGQHGEVDKRPSNRFGMQKLIAVPRPGIATVCES